MRTSSSSAKWLTFVSIVALSHPWEKLISSGTPCPSTCLSHSSSCSPRCSRSIVVKPWISLKVWAISRSTRQKQKPREIVILPVEALLFRRGHPMANLQNRWKTFRWNLESRLFREIYLLERSRLVFAFPKLSNEPHDGLI